MGSKDDANQSDGNDKEKSSSVSVYEEDYEVEEVVNHRDTAKGRMYEVKWKGWDSSTNTWEPMKHLVDCKHLVTRYENKINEEIKQNNEDEQAENEELSEP